MFADILKKELKINFYKDINCNTFEIPKDVFEILNEAGFKKPIKHIWYEGQTVFNYTFDR
jgi:hypothetical protein